MYPLSFALHRDHQRWLGMGLTPEDQVQSDVLATEADTYHWQVGDAYMEGISTAVVALVGMGVAGLSLFLLTILFSLRSVGALMIGSFFFANLVSAGYNSVACFVPAALLLALVLHARRVGMADRADAAVGPDLAFQRPGIQRAGGLNWDSQGIRRKRLDG